MSRITGLMTHLVKTQGLGLLALLLVLTGGAAYAATAAKDSVVSRSIKNGQVKTVDIKAGAITGAQLATGSVDGSKIADAAVSGSDIEDSSLVGDDIKDGTITGADVLESTLGTVNNAAALEGVSAAALMRSQVYKRTVSGVGTLLGDSTYTQALPCDPGDILLNGGPGGIAKEWDVLESTPSGGAGVANSWTVRIDKNGAGTALAYTVVVVCADQS